MNAAVNVVAVQPNAPHGGAAGLRVICEVSAEHVRTKVDRVSRRTQHLDNLADIAPLSIFAVRSAMGNINFTHFVFMFVGSSFSFPCRRTAP